MEIDFGSDFTVYLNLTSFFVGLAKSGLSALGGLVTPLLLLPLSEPRLAVGLGTVLFVAGDLGAALYYLRLAQFGVLLRLLPIASSGMLGAFLLGKYIPTGPYLIIITAFSGAALAMLLYHKRTPSSKHSENCIPQDSRKVAEHPRSQQAMLLFSGIMAGFTTVLGNVSGIFMNLYLSALKLPKQGFVATMALFYLIINTIKLLIYYFYWQSIDSDILIQTGQRAFWVVPSLLGGLVLGIFSIHKMNERIFSFCVVLASAVSFILLLWRTLQHFQAL